MVNFDPNGGPGREIVGAPGIGCVGGGGLPAGGGGLPGGGGGGGGLVGGVGVGGGGCTGGGGVGGGGVGGGRGGQERPKPLHVDVLPSGHVNGVRHKLAQDTCPAGQLGGGGVGGGVVPCTVTTPHIDISPTDFCSRTIV